MSASREKRTHQTGSNKTDVQSENRSSGALYAVAGVIVAVVVVALLVYNSGLLGGNAPAVTINGEEYSAADVNFYYSSNYQYGAYYYSMMGAYDTTLSPKDQVYDEGTGQTWHEFFLEQSLADLRQEAALAAEAEKAGHVLSEAGQQTMNQALISVETGWINGGYANRDAFLTANLGSGMTYDKYVECLNRSALASEYANSYASSLQFDQAELDAYYAENKDALDSYTFTLLQFRATVPTVDEEGNPIAMTEEETAAALEEAKEETRKTAQEAMARLEAGEDAEKLQEEYEDSLAFSYVSHTTQGSAINTNYADWLFDAQRKSGDITLVEYEGTSNTMYNYCVVRMEDRRLDDSATADIRHILVGAGSDPTEEEYAQALTRAEELLAQWEAGGATEDQFAQLATEHSEDTSSAANGGLLNVSTYDSYGQAFVDWALDPSRESGDTGFVKNDFSSTKGYHLMYYVGDAAPYWQQTVESTLASEAYSAWLEELLTNYTLETGSGLENVG